MRLIFTIDSYQKRFFFFLVELNQRSLVCTCFEPTLSQCAIRDIGTAQLCTALHCIALPALPAFTVHCYSIGGTRYQPQIQT